MLSGAFELGASDYVKGFLGVRVALGEGGAVTGGDLQGRRTSVAKAHILPRGYALILSFRLQWLCCALVWPGALDINSFPASTCLFAILWTRTLKWHFLIVVLSQLITGLSQQSRLGSPRSLGSTELWTIWIDPKAQWKEISQLKSWARMVSASL